MLRCVFGSASPDGAGGLNTPRAHEVRKTDKERKAELITILENGRIRQALEKAHIDNDVIDAAVFYIRKGLSRGEK